MNWLISILIHITKRFSFSTPAARGSKTPLWNSESSIATVFEFLDRSCKYIGELCTATGVPILQSKRKGWAFGYCSNTAALRGLVTDIFEPASGFSYFLTYKICQDPLELFFGEIRQRGGFNNNPNAEQFW